VESSLSQQNNGKKRPFNLTPLTISKNNFSHFKKNFDIESAKKKDEKSKTAEPNKKGKIFFQFNQPKEEDKNEN
jgi:hypothetical protein